MGSVFSGTNENSVGFQNRKVHFLFFVFFITCNSLYLCADDGDICGITTASIMFGTCSIGICEWPIVDDEVSKECFCL